MPYDRSFLKAKIAGGLKYQPMSGHTLKQKPPEYGWVTPFLKESLAIMAKGGYPKYECSWLNATSSFHCFLWSFHIFSGPFPVTGEKMLVNTPMTLVEKYG